MPPKKPAAAASSKTLEGRFDPNDPADWAKYWATEFAASRKEGSGSWTGIDRFLERGQRVVDRYRASKKGSNRPNDARINIFPANIQTQRAILVGQVPRCEVSRRYEDPDDDIARIGSTILERILNKGLEEDSYGFASVMSRCTEDFLLPGMCGSRVQFSAEFEPVPEKPAQVRPCPCTQQPSPAYWGMAQGVGPAQPPVPQPPVPGMDLPPGLAPPAMDQGAPPMPGAPDPACPMCGGTGEREVAPALPATEKPINEKAEVSYVHWRDQLWSVARTNDEVRWRSIAAEMSRKELVAMFGEEEGRAIPVATAKKGQDKDARRETPWSRARVWEIWSKEHKRLFWFIEGHPRVVFPVENPEGKDPLGLEEFYPCPMPMMANATTDACLPTADYDYAKDLYDEADELTARIRGIVRAIKVVGAYDKNSAALKRVLEEACELEMIPIQNFSEFVKSGGMRGAMDLLPIDGMVQTVQALVAQRNIVIEGIYQITGMSDIIRGQQAQSETATTSAIKARYASVRLQDRQREVARYATDIQRLRKEVIAKHWSVEAIIEQSAIMESADGETDEGKQKILEAVKLIKDRHLDFRVVIKPEQISLQDWAQLKQQRSDVLQSLGAFFQSSIPFIQLTTQAGPLAVKAAMKLVVRNAQWLVAGMPGASGVEAAFDSFVAQMEQLADQAAQQPPAPPKPDPKVQAAGIKAQGDIAKTQAATQGRLAEVQAETQASVLTREHDARMDVLTDQAKTDARIRADAVRQTAAVLGPVNGGVQ